MTLENVLVDTGATTLCLPADVIDTLGLSLLKEVDVATAMGTGRARIFQDAKMMLCDREGTFECLELPGGQRGINWGDSFRSLSVSAGSTQSNFEGFAQRVG